jgi:two-component system response regulator VicR
MQKRMLIIEDDPDIMEILSIIFTEEGFEVVLSATGDESDHLTEIKPDIILLDIRLKNAGQNGIAICIKIKSRKETSSVPVILLSAETDLSWISKNCGADAYVAKPFDIVYLSEKVQQLLTHTKP